MPPDRIAVALRGLASTLPEGARLPSVRELMRVHGASPVTVQRAIAGLAAEGLVTPRPGRGTFVAAAPASDGHPDLGWQEVALGSSGRGTDGLMELLALPPEGALALSSGYLDPALQPTAALAASLARAGRRPGAWERPAIEGVAALRAWFAREAGGHFAAHDVVICPGGQAALVTAVRALASSDSGDEASGRGRGGTVLVEPPTYRGALAGVRAAGLAPLPVPSDADGIRPELLAEALERTGARVVYLQPLHANPHGADLAVARRAEVIAIAAGAGAFLVEDDWARDLTIDGPAPAPLAADDVDGHVVYVRSLSKAASPGLRVAAVAARGPAGARLRAARVVEDLFVSAPLQHAALDLVSSPGWRRHLKALRAGLRERRSALIGAVERDLGPQAIERVPTGGLHLWVRLPDGTDEPALIAAAARAGVIVSGGGPSFAAEPTGPHLRITFGGAPPDVLVEGVGRLAALLPGR
jgi:DNA-binding transcriptional MocR family regulator